MTKVKRKFRFKHGFLSGVTAELKRVSSQSYTLILLETRKAFKIGDQINCDKFDVEEIKES